jgi:signal transduction histidine kinase
MDERARRGSEVILRNADRAIVLLQDCFDLLRAENGTLPLDPMKERIGPVLQEAVDRFEPEARQRTVTLHRELPVELGEALFDRQRVQHAVRVLLDHALGRTLSGGSIGLEASAGPSSVKVEVWDHGSPLPDAELSSLFDPELQSVKDRKLGIGFRLGVMAAEVRAQGGHVSARSGADTGTALSFTLPRG